MKLYLLMIVDMGDLCSWIMLQIIQNEQITPRTADEAQFVNWCGVGGGIIRHL